MTIRWALSLMAFLGILAPLHAQQAADPAAYANYGAQLASQGKCPEALQYLEYAAAQNGTLPGVWMRIGYCKESTGNSAAAVEAYRKAVAADPADAYSKQRLEALAPSSPVLAAPPAVESPAAQAEAASPAQVPEAEGPVAMTAKAPAKFSRFHFSVEGGLKIGLGKEFKDQAKLWNSRLDDWSQFMTFSSRSVVTGSSGALFGVNADFAILKFLSLGLGLKAGSIPSPLTTAYAEDGAFASVARTIALAGFSTTAISFQPAVHLKAPHTAFSFGLRIGSTSASLKYTDDNTYADSSGAASLHAEAKLKGSGLHFGAFTNAAFRIAKPLELYLGGGAVLGKAFLRGPYSAKGSGTGAYSSWILDEAYSWGYYEYLDSNGDTIRDFEDTANLAPDAKEVPFVFNSAEFFGGLRYSF